MRHRNSVVLTASFLMAFSGQGIAQLSEGQFLALESPSTGIMTLSASELDRGIMSRNKVIVDVQALIDGSMIQPFTNPKKVLVQPEAGNGFLMQLPDGTMVTLVTKRLQSFVKGVETYSGRVKDIESGFFTLSIENDRVFGQVDIEYMSYDIRYDKASRSHALTEIDKARMPKHDAEPLGDGTAYQEALQALSFPVPLLSGSAIGTVRVLILYGSDVSDPSTLASNIISKMNDTFFDDKMDPDLHVTLADLRNLNDDLDGVCKEDILELMQDEDAPFASIATWVDDEDADVVLTIATTDPSVTNCPVNYSYGRIGGQASDLLDSTYPFAVTMDTYAIGDLTAVHELGHVLGGGHPTWPVSTLEYYSDDVEPYSRSYIAGDGDWQTVMGAYDDNDCDFSTTLPNADCVRIPYWSDPTKSYDSETRGVTYTSDTQDPYSADMASALEIQMPIAAVFEPYPDAAPSTPGNFSVNSRHCYGSTGSSWDSVSTAENYQLLMSIFSDFRDSDREVIYFGPNTQKNIMLPYGFLTYYFKVRACNGSGCSNWSAYDTATYYHGCL